MADFRKTVFQPLHPEKLIGRTHCQARSSWELRFMRFLDANPNILEWSSESIAIKYYDPTTKKIRRYFPDFLIKYKNREGAIIVEVVEIKPFKQTIPPKVTAGKRKKTVFTEAKAWAVNSAKWKAAEDYCAMRGLKFRIMTEKDLHI